MADAVVYVYAVGDAVLADEADAFVTVGGVDHAPVRVIASGPLAAVVSSVDPNRFGEEALRRQLEDLPWLEETARAHHQVVEAAFRLHPVAPVGLATVYLSDDNVSALLDAATDRISAAIERVRGRVEWGVKTFAVVESVAAQSERPGADAGLGPGAAYLRRKHAARDQATRRQRRLAEAAEEAHRSLAAVAIASRRYPVQDPRLSGRQDEMVMNAAYLVDEAAAESFTTCVEGWPGAAVRLELTGPWVPYSFAELEDA